MAWKRSPAPIGWFPHRGDVCLFSLDNERPAVVISTDMLNRHSLDVCVIPISGVDHRRFSLRPRLRAGEAGVSKESWAKCDQVTTIEKRLAVYPPLGRLAGDALANLEQAVRTALELPADPAAYS